MIGPECLDTGYSLHQLLAIVSIYATTPTFRRVLFIRAHEARLSLTSLCKSYWWFWPLVVFGVSSLRTFLWWIGIEYVKTYLNAVLQCYPTNIFDLLIVVCFQYFRCCGVAWKWLSQNDVSRLAYAPLCSVATVWCPLGHSHVDLSFSIMSRSLAIQ